MKQLLMLFLHQVLFNNVLDMIVLYKQTGIPVKVTVESASTSEAEETEGILEDIMHDPDITKSADKLNVKQYQQLQV